MRGARQHDEKDTLAVVPWYWRDWRASKARAYFISTKNWLGLACYRELLDAHWGEDDCALPGDDVELAALAGVGLEEWLSVKDIVVRWLDTTEDGRRRNPRAFREWKRARNNRTTARQKAKKAAKALWDKKKPAMLQACSEHAPSNAQAVLEVCPPSPTPSPSPSPTPSITDRTNERRGAPASPFIPDRAAREALERDALRLTSEIAALTGDDSAEVFAHAAHYDGAKRQKLNPATMSDDRLLATVRDLRTNLKAVQSKRPAKVS